MNQIVPSRIGLTKPIVLLPLIAVLFLIMPEAAKASGCPDGTIKVGEKRTETPDAIIVQPLCKVVPQTPPADCTAAEKQAELDRAEIEKNMRGLATGQDELADWSSRSKDAQRDMIVAAVSLVLGQYASDLGDVKRHMATLDGRLGATMARLQRTQTDPQRLKLLAKASEILAEMKPFESPLATKQLAEAASSGMEGWSVARDTLHNEFRVAAKHNQDVQAMLKDPEVRRALSGDDLEHPADEVMSVMADASLEQLGQFGAALKSYEDLTGPTVRIAEFVRDMAYNSLLQYMIVRQVNQQNDLAGKFAEAAGVLQVRYKRTIDRLGECRKSR